MMNGSHPRGYIICPTGIPVVVVVIAVVVVVVAIAVIFLARIALQPDTPGWKGMITPLFSTSGVFLIRLNTLHGLSYRRDARVVGLVPDTGVLVIVVVVLASGVMIVPSVVPNGKVHRWHPKLINIPNSNIGSPAFGMVDTCIVKMLFPNVDFTL